MSPSDIGAIVQLAQHFEPNPKKLVLRAMGLTSSEAEQGIPGWAWAAALLVGGAAIGLVVAIKFPAVREKTETIIGGRS